MSKQQVEAELHKEQFMARFRKALTKSNRKQDDMQVFVGAKPEEEVDVNRQGESVEDKIKKTLYGDEKFAKIVAAK